MYVPRPAFGEAEPSLQVEVQNRDVLDRGRSSWVGRCSVPFSEWGTGGAMRELELPLEVPPEHDVDIPEDEDGKPRVPRPVLRLQLQYDAFGEPLGPQASALEAVEDVLPEGRSRRRRYGSAVPSDLLSPDPEKLSDKELERALRRRVLPCLGEGRQDLEERLQTSLRAEGALRGGLWSTLESVVGSGARQSLEGALGAAASVAETFSGDVFGALGAGLASGFSEVAGVKELMKGDFKGALNLRQQVVEAAMTEGGRAALQRKADEAMKRARQQAMLRLAGGMEMMSVRKGAWKVLEQAVQDEHGGSETFADYEPLAYLEARSTGTECWVWRLAMRRRLIVAFRGTCEAGDVLTDIAATPRDLGELGNAHSGFTDAYASIRDALHAVLARGCSGSPDGWEVIFTGHSLGGALSVLASLDFARQAARGTSATEGGDPVPLLQMPAGQPTLAGAHITACTFGAPRVGDARLCAACDEHVQKAWRIYSSSDIIPRFPPTSFFGFRHSGVGVELDPDSNSIRVRGRNPQLQTLAEEEARKKAEQQPGAGKPQDGKGNLWSSFDMGELAELRGVLGAGTQAVGEHMEDNYFRRIQECLSAKISSRPADSGGGIW